MTTFYSGDIPADPLYIDPFRYDDQIDLSLYGPVTITMRDANGNVIPANLVGTIQSDEIAVMFPASTSIFSAGGLYSLTPTLTRTGGRLTLAPVYIVVQVLDGWHTLDSARDEWIGAPTNDKTLFELLETAKSQVLAFGPKFQSNFPPVSFKAAQLMQARNLWNSAQADPQGQINDDGFAVRPYPLDWVVKAILRPRQALGAIG